MIEIYTSRNSFRLLNRITDYKPCTSTQVEILLGYLTMGKRFTHLISTQVEILLGYLTNTLTNKALTSTQVEILLGYLTVTQHPIE